MGKIQRTGTSKFFYSLKFINRCNQDLAVSKCNRWGHPLAEEAFYHANNFDLLINESLLMIVLLLTANGPLFP